MTGSDGQLTGLVYDEDGWSAYAHGIWVMSQRRVTIAPGAAFTLRRRIVSVAAGRDGDPWGPLGRL